MSTSARVDSIDSIKEFRAYLTKFQESASMALGDAESEINRTLMWLEGEQTSFWMGQIKKRQEVLAKAEEALRYKRLYKDASGGTPSAVDEMKAVQKAKKDFADAQQKLTAVKQWVRRLGKEYTLYRGHVARFSNQVSAGVPGAINYLGSTIEKLEKYVGLGPATPVGESSEIGGAGAFAAAAESSGPSMARDVDDAPAPEKEENKPESTPREESK